MLALTPVPTQAQVRALTRAELEAAYIEGAYARCRLEQRVNELEAQEPAPATTPPPSKLKR